MRYMKKVAPENVKAYHSVEGFLFVFFRQVCGERNAKDFAESINYGKSTREDEKRKHTVQCTIDMKVPHSSGANVFIIKRGESEDRIASIYRCVDI